MRKFIIKIGFVSIVSLFILGLFSCSNSKKTYTVKWIDQDGNVLETDNNVENGMLPEFNGTIPGKESDKKYDYNFRSWYPVVLPVDGDVTYVADFTPVRKSVDPNTGEKKNWYDSSVEWVMTNKNKFLFNVTGGGAICSVLNGIFNLADCKELTSKNPFDELKDELDDIQGQLDEGFRNVENLMMELTANLSTELKNEIKQAERNIETAILTQTTIANKGDSFDSLLTTMKATERSLEAIANDQTLSKQDKALSVARLIGNYSDWGNSSNLFASYMSFLDAVTKSTYSTTYDKLLFDLVYDEQMVHSKFTSEAISRGAPYVEKILYLAFFAYSICEECILAHQAVANFTSRDLANLSATNRAIYSSIVSPYSVIVTQDDYLNSKVLELGFADSSIMDGMTKYFDRNEHGGIVAIFKQGEAGIKIDEELLVDSFTPSEFNDAYAAIGIISEMMDDRIYYYDNMQNLLSHIKQYYSGISFREFLSLIGCNVENIPNGAYFIIELDDDPNFAAARYKGVNIDDKNCILTTIVVYEGNGQGVNNTVVTFQSAK